MALSLSAFGSKIAQEVRVAVGCVVLLAVYRKLNNIPFDREDFREASKVFGSYALAATIGFVLVSLFHWIFHP